MYKYNWSFNGYNYPGEWNKNRVRTVETKRKQSEALKGKPKTEEHKRKISKSWETREWSKTPEETKRKKRESALRQFKDGMPEEHKRKIKEALSKPEIKKKMRESQSNRRKENPVTIETKRKLRESTINYVEKTSGRFSPMIGKNEKRHLDELEKKMGYRIDRDFKILGFFPDGYIHELNLIVEVDERPKTNPKDIEREKIIKKALNCEFLRIKDYD